MSEQDNPAVEPKGSSRRRRRWPWITGLVVAFALGGGAGLGLAGGVEPEVIIETETVVDEVEVEPVDMEERREALDERESVLDDRDKTLTDRASNLEEQEEAIEQAEAALEEREEAVAQEELNLEENTIPGSGTFLVGEDIKPGTYRTHGGGSQCFWDRLSGLSGEEHHIIAFGYPQSIGYVTISESDMAFATNSCGDWIRQ